MLNAQRSGLALTNLQQAQALAQATPDYNDCCGVGDFFLQINFERAVRVYENCTVVPGEALLFYPGGGTSGTATVCVTFPTSSNVSGGFELYDNGDFTTTIQNGDDIQICRDVSYPNLSDDGEDLGFVRSNFYVVPTLDDPIFTPTVETISGSVSAGSLSCSCDTSPISFSFSKDNGRSQFTTPNRSDLSGILDQNCAYCLPPLSSPNSRSDVYLYGGGVNVDVDYTFGASGQNRPFSLTLGSGFDIVIQDGATLDLRNIEISGCKTMWGAITIEDGGELIISPGFSTIGSLMKSKVSDGEHGIIVEDGAKLTVDNTVFTENLIGITTLNDDLSKSPQISVFGSEFNFGEGVVEESIVIEPFLLQPHFGETPRAGIEVFDVEDGFIVDYGLASSGPSKFENLENGIIFENSIGYVSGSIFDWMRSTNNTESGNGILIKQDVWYRARNYVQSNLNHPSGTVSFKNSPRGINAVDPYSLYVRYVDFENVDFGIYSENANFLKVYDNTFDSNLSGVTVLENRAASVRIRDNDFIARKKGEKSNAVRLAYTTGFFSRRAEIKDNNFTLAGAPVGIDATNPLILDVRNNDFGWEANGLKATAILVQGGSSIRARGNFINGANIRGDTLLSVESTGFSFSSSNNVDLQCNRVENIGIGALFQGNNGRSTIRGNILENSGIGLQVGTSLTSGVFDIVGRQVHTGNQWLGTFGDAGAKYLSDQVNVRFSEFLVDNDGPGFIPPSWTPLNSEFITVEPNSPIPFYACPTGLPPNGNFTGDEDYIKKLLAGQFIWSRKLGAAEWMANVRALADFDRGELNESIVPGITNWANSQALANERIAAQRAIAVAEALGPLTVGSDQVVDQTEVVDNTYIEYVNTVLAGYRAEAAGTPVDSSSINEAKGKLAVAQANLTQLLVYPPYDQAQKIATARNQNSGGGYARIHHANETEINDYLLTLVEFGKDSLNQHVSNVLAIANQCPDVGGPAVFSARSLAAILGHDLVYDDSSLCVKKEKEDRKPFTVNLGEIVQIFPNPAKGQFIVSSGTKAIVGINVVDALGRITLHLDFSPKAMLTQHSINTSKLNSGMYLVVLELADGTTVSRKVSIQR